MIVQKESFLFLPYAYGFNTRAKTIIHRLSFALFIVVPIFFNVMFMTSFSANFFVFFLSFSGMYIIYEIGYIYNDFYTARFEKNPTRWLKTEQMEEYANTHYTLLISVRIVYLACIFMILYYCFSISNYTLYAMGLSLLYFSFSLHNYYRGKINIMTDCLLNTTKYLVPLLLFVNHSKDLWFLLFLFVEIPVVRTIEYAIGKRYFFRKLWSINIDTLRVLYYSVLSCVSGLVSLYNPFFIWFFWGAFYLLIFRIIGLIMGKRKMISSIRKQNGDRKESE